MRYVVTGGTGFIGRRVVSQILASSQDAEVWVLVRRESLARFERLALDWGERVKPLVGDLTTPDLGLTDETTAELGAIEHVVHCAAIYDMTAGEDEQRAANVEGTRAVIALARRLDATLHHVSSIAVAGTYRGTYTEDDFDVAQDLPTPYHQTKFEAEIIAMTLDVLNGQTVSADVFLKKGIYTVSFMAATKDGSPLAAVTYSLLARKITEPLDPVPINPLDPPSPPPNPIGVLPGPFPPPPPNPGNNPWWT